MTSSSSRRDIKTRNAAFAQLAAKKLAVRGISPNAISTASMGFSLLGLLAFYAARDSRIFLLLAAVMIQLRLLCNLFDGMVAIEYNKKTKTGDLYNEVPDRVSDALLIMGAGIYSKDFPYGMDLAWASIFLATMTAYIRVFGAALVAKHFFLGPMSKQHRMFILTLASVLGLFIYEAVYAALIVMLVGLVITNIRRLQKVAQELESK